MKIPTDMIENSMEHRYAGNGWAVVSAHEDEWCDAVSVGNATVANQIFRVWRKCLKVEKVRENQGTIEQPRWVTTDKNVTIHHTLLYKIKQIRADLSSGRKVIKNTRLIDSP